MKKACKRIIEEAEKDTFLVLKNNGFINYYKTTEECGISFGGSLFSPFELDFLYSGEYYIKVSPLIFNEIIDFLIENNYNLFDEENINKFLGCISETLNNLKWNIDNRSNTYSSIYAVENLNLLNTSKILNTTFEITAPTDYINISGSYNVASGSNTYFCTILDSKIVSICGYNYMGFESVDIGTATNENHRQRGYSVSNVVSMAKYILNKEKGVFYSCAHTNTASQKTALSAGFNRIANRYILFCNK